jgi:type I restriction enzyme M protein
MALTRAAAETHEHVVEAGRRGFIEIKPGRVTYHLNQKRSYEWGDPEEWVRCIRIAGLVLEKQYPPNRMRTEVPVPRRVPNDSADIVVYRDDECRDPYLVVECKSDPQSAAGRAQGIEQMFGNANSLRAPLALYDQFSDVVFYDVGNHPAGERDANVKGGWRAVPEQYGRIPEYTYIAGPGNNDVQPVKPHALETKVRRAHSTIWSGGKRDPLNAFDEWSKLLFAKVEDERNTPNGQPRKFQVGTNETTAAVANRIHGLFNRACRTDPSIFPPGTRIELPDRKIYEVAKMLQDLSITNTSTDSIGVAFESFFGSVFRGELGQYFTMRQIARFAVALLDVTRDDYGIDPTAGSGGFLLELLLQVWHAIDAEFAGQPELKRIKNDFALHKVYGIEIHPVLARICKINLLLHHDGHTNIEGDRSALDSVFSLPRLNPPSERFTVAVANPPFGDEVQEGDVDILGSNSLAHFEVAAGKLKVPSEHVVLERTINLLEEGGRLGMVIPDGLLNNQGEASNCPQVRRYLARNGVILAIVSLPDYAFRKSGAQNKTSILFYRRFTASERVRFEEPYQEALAADRTEDRAIAAGLDALGYRVFLAEANHVGYTSTGAASEKNDLYRGGPGGQVADDQAGTILSEYRRFREDPNAFTGGTGPDCMAIGAAEMWQAHESHRLDPKYFLFKREERTITPPGWIRLPLARVMIRREEIVQPETEPEAPVRVMTIGQSGEIRAREAGKGRNPPDWIGMYFEDSPSTWYQARGGDVVFSSIDLWKGCIAVVPREFDGALVTKEFPIYEVSDKRLDPEFLSCLLRSRYYQRAFRAITTGHSNRRRTQPADFENLEICFPADRELQRQLIQDVLGARANQREAADTLRQSMLRFSDALDHRGEEEYEVVDEATVESE